MTTPTLLASAVYPSGLFSLSSISCFDISVPVVICATALHCTAVAEPLDRPPKDPKFPPRACDKCYFCKPPGIIALWLPARGTTLPVSSLASPANRTVAMAVNGYVLHSGSSTEGSQTIVRGASGSTSHSTSVAITFPPILQLFGDPNRTQFRHS